MKGGVMRSLIHHIDLSVRDVAVLGPFYDAVPSFMGYRRTRERVDGIDRGSRRGRLGLLDRRQAGAT